MMCCCGSKLLLSAGARQLVPGVCSLLGSILAKRSLITQHCNREPPQAG